MLIRIITIVIAGVIIVYLVRWIDDLCPGEDNIEEPIMMPQYWAKKIKSTYKIISLSLVLHFFSIPLLERESG